jgi:NADH:ubiquinone oxidoreductase subunit H
MMELLQTMELAGQNLFGAAWLPVWTLVKILAIVLPIMITVAYLTLAERKVIGYMQIPSAISGCCNRSPTA